MGSNLHAGQFFGNVRKQFRTGGITLTEVTHASARKLPRHAHESVYVSMLLSGSYKESIGSRELESKPLDVVFHPAAFEHKDEIGASGARFFSLEINSRWLSRIGAQDISSVAPARLTGDAAVTMRRLLAGVLDGQTTHLRAESLVAELLAGLTKSEAAVEKRPKWLARVEEFLRSQFCVQLTLEQVAKIADVHPVHLSRVFRKTHGMTMGDYLNQLRADCVARNLADPDRTLADLAYDAGFADQAHLTRVFKRINGITPGALRRALQ